MATLIVDIETSGENWDQIDSKTKSMLTERIQKTSSDISDKEAEAQARNQLGLQPFTGKIITIGALDFESGKSVVWYDPNQDGHKISEKGEVKFIPLKEKEMLMAFWSVAARFHNFVTFSGRGLDGPFLMLRSAINGIKPSKDLMRARYLYQQSADSKHIDLYEQLSFYGATYNRNGGLHLACRAFGIETPKGDDIDGSQVGMYYEEGRTLEIAEYNARDLVATAALYKKWDEFLNF